MVNTLTHFIHGLGPARAPAQFMCIKAPVRAKFINFFVGPTLWHVKWWGLILGPDVLEGKL